MNKDFRYKKIVGGTHKFVKNENGRYFIEPCRGCKTYETGMESLTDEERLDCVYLCNVSVPINIQTGEVCPCSYCVVKMMCNTKCDELDKFVETPSKIGDDKS